MEKTLPNGKRKIFKDVWLGNKKIRAMKYELNKDNLVDIFSTATYGSDWLAIKRPKRFEHLIKQMGRHFTWWWYGHCIYLRRRRRAYKEGIFS